MNTGFEVTDGRRAARTAAIGVAALLVMVLGVVALVVRPLLDRVDTTLNTLNDALPVLQDVGPDVASLERGIDERLAPSLEEVERALGGVEGSLGQLQALSTVVEGLDRTAGGVDSIASELGDLGGSLAAVVDALDRMLVLLEEVEGHVENLDRKSGPFAPPGDTDAA